MVVFPVGDRFFVVSIVVTGGGDVDIILSFPLFPPIVSFRRSVYNEGSTKPAWRQVKPTEVKSTWYQLNNMCIEQNAN